MSPTRRFIPVIEWEDERHLLGVEGERLAIAFLISCGWSVEAHRFRLGHHDIDLVVRKGRTVAFVEVKWRASDAQRDLAIDQRRLQRVARAAEALAPRYARHGEDIRIDVLLLAPRRWPRHIVNAWQP